MAAATNGKFGKLCKERMIEEILARDALGLLGVDA